MAQCIVYCITVLLQYTLIVQNRANLTITPLHHTTQSDQVRKEGREREDRDLLIYSNVPFFSHKQFEFHCWCED